MRSHTSKKNQNGAKQHSRAAPELTAVARSHDVKERMLASHSILYVLSVYFAFSSKTIIMAL
jgi:hypothetical protein